VAFVQVRCLETPTSAGHPPHVGGVTEQPDDWLSAIANGYGIALAPESAARFQARPGVTYRPVIGVSPTHVGVAWPPAADTDPIVQDVVHRCLDSRSAPQDVTATTDRHHPAQRRP
jgi:DNA-binding transcriptional LysR family regulator